jgi:hypothetical protein
MHFGEGDSLATHCLLLAVEFTAKRTFLFAKQPGFYLPAIL